MLAASAAALGCNADIQAGFALPAAGGTPGAAPSAEPVATLAALPLPPSAGLRRLTREEFGNSLRDLLGVTVALELEPDTRLDGFEKVGAGRVAVSPVGTELYQRAVYQALDSLWADSSKLGLVVNCDPASDPSCAASVISRFGRRAWRRTLSSDEVTRYVGVANGTGKVLNDPQAGLENALAGLLQSPNFVYRVELGEADPTNSTRLRYTGVELATRLSFFLTNSTPDEALTSAAEHGELDSPGGISQHTQRLLATPQGHESIRGFARELFNLPAVDTVPKDPALYPELTPTLRASLREEVERMWETAAFAPNHQLLDVLTTRDTFVDDELASLYGLPKPGQSAMAPVTLPDSGQRAGLLGTGAFLAVRAKSNETTPTLRGRFVREVLMCQTVPAPPPNVNTTLPAPPAGVTLTRRQQLEAHRASPTCAGCHALMDPIGLALENFDAIGRFRDMDRGLPIDTTGDLDGAPFNGLRQLNQLLRDSPSVRSCLLRNLYRYVLGQSEASGGEAWIDELAKKFDESGQHFGDFTLAFVTSDLFRFAAPPAPTKESL